MPELRPRNVLEQDRSTTRTRTLPFIDTPSWMLDAACRGVADPDVFFPEEGGDHAPTIMVCHDCPVRVECLAYALNNNEPHGVWGGTTAPTRRSILRRRQGMVA